MNDGHGPPLRRALSMSGPQPDGLSHPSHAGPRPSAATLPWPTQWFHVKHGGLPPAPSRAVSLPQRLRGPLVRGLCHRTQQATPTAAPSGHAERQAGVRGQAPGPRWTPVAVPRGSLRPSPHAPTQLRADAARTALRPAPRPAPPPCRRKPRSPTASDPQPTTPWRGHATRWLGPAEMSHPVARQESARRSP